MTSIEPGTSQQIDEREFETVSDSTAPGYPKKAQPGEVVTLDASALVAVIRECLVTDSLAAIRQAMSALLERLSHPNDPLRSTVTGEQTVAFRRGFLVAEVGQIAKAQTTERAHYYLTRLLKSIHEVRTSAINDINLNRWKEYEDIYTDSLWIVDKRDSSGVHSAGYWGNFIPQIPHQMMRRYTKKGEWVLDTFAGSGTTLIEGQRLGRNTIGIELQPEMVEYTRRLVANEPNPHSVTLDVVNADSASADFQAILQERGIDSVQLALLHPPYFDIIQFSDDPRDLSNAASVEDFLQQMSRIVQNVAAVLDKGRYLVLVIGDKYAGGEWIPLGFQTMTKVLEHGFSLKSIVVKNFEDTSGKRNQKELWRYRALAGGFYIFKHEYIFILRKQ